MWRQGPLWLWVRVLRLRSGQVFLLLHHRLFVSNQTPPDWSGASSVWGVQLLCWWLSACWSLSAPTSFSPCSVSLMILFISAASVSQWGSRHKQNKSPELWKSSWQLKLTRVWCKTSRSCCRYFVQFCKSRPIIISMVKWSSLKYCVTQLVFVKSSSISGGRSGARRLLRLVSASQSELGAETLRPAVWGLHCSGQELLQDR